MNSDSFREVIRQTAASLAFAWTWLTPKSIQTFHQLAIDSCPETRGITAPSDAPVYDLVLGTQVRPSEMQGHLLDTVVPVTLVAIQSLAEDLLEAAFLDGYRASRRIESMVDCGYIDRTLAERAHYWRIVRNVIAHAQGVIDEATEREVARLRKEGRITFDRFRFWGPLVDARTGGDPVPIVERAVQAPDQSDAELLEIEITVGNRIRIGIGDLLAAGNVWATLLEAAP